jgi:hypothetical protein
MDGAPKFTVFTSRIYYSVAKGDYLSQKMLFFSNQLQ